MKQILHILGKDLRRYAWAWLTLLACASADVYLLGTTAGLLDSRPNEALAMLTSLIGGILFFVTMVLVVQEESLADPDAYWLSRPVGRVRLLASKLLFFLILILGFQITDAINLIMNGGGARTPYALLETLGILAVWQAQIFLAAQTRSLPRYLLLVVSIIVGFYALILGMIFCHIPALNSLLTMDWGLLPPTIAHHWLAWIQTLFWLVSGLALLAFLYLKRRPLVAWALLVPVILLAGLLTPGDSLFGIISTKHYGNKNEDIKLDHLRKGSTTHIHGDEFVEILAFFAVSGEAAGGDIWASVLSPKIRIAGKELDLKADDGIKRFNVETGNLRSISLGYIKRADLKNDESGFSVDGLLNLSTSVQTPVGTLNMQEGAAYVGGGNRLIVRSITRDDDDLEVDLAGSIPAYRFEPNHSAKIDEPFGGRFSFALLHRDMKEVRDFHLSTGFGFNNKIARGTIRTKLSRKAPLEDYTITVFQRKVTGTAFLSIDESAVSLKDGT